MTETHGPWPTDIESASLMVRLAKLEIDPTQLEASKAQLAEAQETAERLEPGVVMLHSVALDGDSAQIRLLEVYAGPAAYAAHIQTDHFLAYKRQTIHMIRSLDSPHALPVQLCPNPGP